MGKLIPFPGPAHSVPPQPPATTAPKRQKIRLLNRYEQRNILDLFYDRSHSITYIARVHGLAESQIENVIRQCSRELPETGAAKRRVA